ncbi:hypothetical protein MY10362_001497 [Beauveria mimosiformis]
MVKSEDSTCPSGTTQGNRTEPEPIVVEGVNMPSLSELTSFNASLHHCAADYYRSLNEHVLEPMRDKQRQRVKDANRKYSGTPITVADSVNWTPELEKRAKEELEATKEHWTLAKTVTPDYLNLCKTALLYTARTPRDIIGIKTQLCFALDPKSGRREYTPHPLDNWSRTFCDKLSQLITHQAWSTGQPGGRAAQLATALQYAVILRTQDTREWRICSADSFMDGILRAVKRGASPPLEEIVEERPERIDADSPYYVTTEDLATLTKALDGLSDPETCLANLSTEMFYKMAMATRPNRGLKPAGNELDAFHEKVMLEECRRLLLYAPSRNDRGGDSVDESDDQGEALTDESLTSGSVTLAWTGLVEVPATPEQRGRAKRPQEDLVERSPKRARIRGQKGQKGPKATKAEEEEEAKNAKEAKEAENQKAQEALVPVREPLDFELPCDQGSIAPIILDAVCDPLAAGTEFSRPFLRDLESNLLRCKWRQHL